MRKLVLLFVLAVGLFGCSESQDPFVEETILKEKGKDILLAVEKILLKEKSKDKEILLARAAAAEDVCLGTLNTMREISREMGIIADRMREETDRLLRGAATVEEVTRVIAPLLHTYEVYSNQYEYVAIIYDACICLNI